jgi:hypothetical protein
MKCKKERKKRKAPHTKGSLVRLSKRLYGSSFN